MNARKVIIDCDPGIDDALALILALKSKELDILGITTVSGNVDAYKGAENAFKILKKMNREEIPVYMGEDKPLKRDYIDATDTHGTDGLGETELSLGEGVELHKDAVGFIRDTLEVQAYSGEKVSIIALGPLTNIAKVVKDYPEVLHGLDEFVSMGGTFKSHGNCSPVAEYNYWCDPDSAKIVYEAFSERKDLQDKLIHMVGLDVTRKILLTPNILEYMKSLNEELGSLIEQITRFYFNFHWKQEEVIGCVINDPLAVAYFYDRSLCEGRSFYTTITTEGESIGESIVDEYDFWKKPKNSFVLERTKPFAFFSLFIEKVFDCKKEEIEPILKQIMTAGDSEDEK